MGENKGSEIEREKDEFINNFPKHTIEQKMKKVKAWIGWIGNLF